VKEGEGTGEGGADSALNKGEEGCFFLLEQALFGTQKTGAT